MTVAARPSVDSWKTTISRALSHLGRNELLEAGALLEGALSEAPDNPSLLHLLGTVRRRERRAGDAEALYHRSLALDATQPHVHRDLGKLLAALGRMDEALGELRESIRLNSADADAHFGLAAVLARQGQHAAAEQSYRHAISLDPSHLMARLGLGEFLCDRGRPEEGERVLREAQPSAAHDPRLAAALAYRLGLALKQQNKYSHALRQFDVAQTNQPDFPAVDFARGETLQQLGRWEEAALWFRKVLARRPGHTNAGACLALISALGGDFTEAREWSTKVLAREPGHGIAHIALAIAEIEAGNCSAAEQRLRDLLEKTAGAKSVGTAIAAGFAAEAFDRHGWYREAFAVSYASKAMLRALWAPQPEAKRASDTARELGHYFETSEPWKAGASPPPGTERPASHVFVLGFQRSGTTLIEAVLATDSRVVHVDEIDFLGAAARIFLGDDAGLDRLAALPDRELTAWRESYWNAVRAARFSVGGKIFVDKMPVNTLRLPLIARLFPAAKIVFAVRDPRDVVLSCFRRHFDPTPYSLEFLRLEDCAHFYAATMTFADICRRKLPLSVLELRYEDMIGDFESSLRKVCDFSGAAWSEAMRDFRDAARTIDLRSASARQLRRGLYAGAVGHWRHYREHLAPVLPILAPWIARFGYQAE